MSGYVRLDQDMSGQDRLFQVQVMSGFVSLSGYAG
jgi:hypothetical protein